MNAHANGFAIGDEVETRSDGPGRIVDLRDEWVTVRLANPPQHEIPNLTCAYFELRPRGSPFFSAATVEGRPVPAMPWLVEGLVPSGTVTLLGGDGGTGKSLLALQLAVAVSTGQAWIGRPVADGAAMFISAEDDRDELHRRLANVARAEGRRLADLARLTLRSLAGADALLAKINPKSGTLARSDLFAAIERRVGEERPVLVVLDTLADLFPGNENDRAMARQFIGLLRGLAIRHHCAVVLLAHPSLSGLNSGSGTSGSTGWSNSVRSRIYFERITDEGFEPDPDLRRLTVKKSNHARVGGEITLRWSDGVFVPEAQETTLDRMAGGIKAERVFLKLLDLFQAQGRYVSPTPSVSFAPSVFAKHPEAEGCTKRALRTAMETLLHGGQIVTAEHGRGASKRQHLERRAK